ncbi:MAG TPA: aspartate dehydrogenase [Thermoplasmatales archaeon]|nr:aspartate dehydrogenase [Thermoplasmatales archaeon]
MKLGMIGCGAIGSDVAEAANDMEEIEEIYVYDIDEEKGKKLAQQLEKVHFKKVEDFLPAVDVVFEAASQQAVYEYAEKIIEAGRDLIIMSIGALFDDEFRERLVQKAKERKCKIYLPSGAVAGLDGIKAASIGGLDEVTLVTTKAPEAFGEHFDKRTVLFDGNAREAIKLFPKNINVAACLSLAGIGFDKTKVKVVADPVIKFNSHKILAHGKFGRLRAEVENLPNPKNPSTSYLASLSAIAVLKKIVNPLQIGI